MENNKEQPETLVRKFLQKSGFPTEWKVARILQNNGFGVGQSIPFKTSGNQISEIDVLSGKTMIAKQGRVIILVQYIIQCKKPKMPWVVFKPITFFDEWRKFEIGPNSESISIDSLQTLFYVWPKPNYFYHQDNVYFSCVDAKIIKEDGNQADNYDRAFKAFQNVISATESTYVDKFTHSINTPIKLLFRIPLVILDGRLFSAELDSDSKPKIEQIEYGQVQVTPANSTDRQLVEISTLEAFEKNLPARVSEFRLLAELLAGDYYKYVLDTATGKEKRLIEMLKKISQEFNIPFD